MNFEAIIGLELHIEMKTNSKVFSSSPVSFGASPNTKLTPFDLSFPGTMPIVNKKAVINAIRVSNALHMEIDNELHFERKNYFYSDLPRGYQITQQFRPIGKNGYVEIEINGGIKRIDIDRLHIEEDTCKQLHNKNETLLDYNRAGIPLLEIVSKPEIRSGEEARKFAEKIRSIVSFLDVSDGKMEEGSLRCDVNISIRPIGSNRLGLKSEIKNLNSFVNIQKAIDFEIKRQEAILLSGGNIKQETRRYDETLKETVSMRAKTNSIDYKYFTEPNIIPIKLSDEFIAQAIESSPELAEVKLKRYQKLGLNEYDSNLLIINKEISEYFDRIVKGGANVKLAANWVIVDIQTILNKKNIQIDEFSVSPEKMGELIKLIEKGEISNKQARQIFEEMQKNNANPRDLINQNGTSLISDEDELVSIIKQVLDDNPQSIVDYKNGKDRAIGFLVGQVMKLTHGKANPNVTNRMIANQLKGE